MFLTCHLKNVKGFFLNFEKNVKNTYSRTTGTYLSSVQTTRTARTTGSSAPSFTVVMQRRLLSNNNGAASHFISVLRGLTT